MRVKRCFVDTSAYVALYYAGDADHQRVKAVFRQLEQDKGHLVTSDYVIDETITRLRDLIGLPATLIAVREILLASRFTLERVTAADFARALEIIAQRPEVDYSFTDCTSFAIMERLGLDVAVAPNGHFARFGRFSLVLPLSP